MFEQEVLLWCISELCEQDTEKSGKRYATHITVQL